MQATGCTSAEAVQAIEESGKNVRVAIVMAKLRVDRAAAEKRLAEAGDNLWQALGTEPRT
jgi:N-acetylmuramic acid 6-phosphate (MurNAc-6-P) etherase